MNQELPSLSVVPCTTSAPISTAWFDGYSYVILLPERYGIEYDVNGDLNGAVTEWLVEEGTMVMADIPPTVRRMVFGWECAALRAPYFNQYHRKKLPRTVKECANDSDRNEGM